MVRPMATLLKMIPMTARPRKAFLGRMSAFLDISASTSPITPQIKPGGVIASAAQGNWQVEEAAYNARDPRDQGTGGKTFCGCG